MDWVGVLFSLSGWYLMPKHRVTAIVVFLLGGVIWITWSISTKTWSILFIQLCYTALNTRTLLIWRKGGESNVTQ